ncbi:receptor-like kinase, partial [Trifolium pratense]
NGFMVSGVGCLVRRGGKEVDGRRAERFFMVKGDSADSGWCGVSLSVRYRYLFDLSLNKLSTVVVMRCLGWKEGGAAWSWRRRLREWGEEMLGECRWLLSDIVLQPTVADHWLWRHDPGDDYTVRSAYLLLTSRDVPDAEVSTDLIWHQQVPLKVSVLV